MNEVFRSTHHGDMGYNSVIAVQGCCRGLSFHQVKRYASGYESSSVLDLIGVSIPCLIFFVILLFLASNSWCCFAAATGRVDDGRAFNGASMFPSIKHNPTRFTV